MRLAIVTTHPVQYYAPVFKLLHERRNVEVKVFYTLGSDLEFDPGFAREIKWDIPLLQGYPYKWAKNTSAHPGTRYFRGIVNPELNSRISAWQPDAILLQGWAYAGHLNVLRHFKGRLPIYFRGDSTLLNHQSFIKRLFKAVFLKWVYRHVSHAFYTGRYNKAYFLRYGMKEKQLSFAPHAVDNARFAEDKTAEALEIRRSLSISPEAVAILYAGKFESVKDLPLLLSAFTALDRKNVHLILAGNGIQEPALKAQARRSGKKSQIHFIHFQNQSQMPALYQACDLFCLPSKNETWGLSVNEAMACGKAILVSDRVGCAPDLVEEGRNGGIFRHGDVNDLHREFEVLTSNKEILVKFGQRSREIISAWTFEHIAIEFERKLAADAQIEKSSTIQA